jgi:GntR family transcriptional regulator
MLSRDTATPLYQQIKQQLLRDIESGVLQPHARLPSERELVRELGVSRITVRQALGELVQQGYLYSAPGKGVFVSEREPGYALDPLLGFHETARARGKTPGTRILECQVVPAPPMVARQLLLLPDDDVVALKRLCLIDGQPTTLQQSWLPSQRVPGLPARDLTNRSLFATLREHYGIQPTSAQVTISARLGSARERELLQLEEPGVVLTVETINFDQHGHPIEWCFDLVHPQRSPLSLAQHLGRP